VAHKALKALAFISAFSAIALPSVSSAEPVEARPMQVQQAVGDYVTKFEEVSNNCKNTGINLSKATVKLERVKGRSIALTVPMVPFLRGAVRKGGKFRAKAKKGKTAIAGVDGRFSAGGRVGDGKIQFVFIAEYFRGKEPLCTQSWNATGTKK
jgi:hypothetical protein